MIDYKLEQRQTDIIVKELLPAYMLNQFQDVKILMYMCHKLDKDDISCEHLSYNVATKRWSTYNYSQYEFLGFIPAPKYAREIISK